MLLIKIGSDSKPHAKILGWINSIIKKDKGGFKTVRDKGQVDKFEWFKISKLHDLKTT